MSDNTIYLNNLNKVVTEAHLKHHFSEFGEITEVHLPKDKKTDELKGYAFITFADADSAQQALEKDGKTFLDKPVTVQIAAKKNAEK